MHTEPIDLDYCLRAFTSEERLEAKYHCSNCQDKQPATKKLQIWRLPPILVRYNKPSSHFTIAIFFSQIIHLKRFDFVNTKWVKTQKVVNFPFKDFDPTAYLASVPQQTILRHKQLLEVKKEELEKSTDSQQERIVEENELETDNKCEKECVKSNVSNGSTEQCKLLHECNTKVPGKNKISENAGKVRARLESTSLIRTPIIDEHLKDYHQHQLLPGQDPFDLRYQLYAVVVSISAFSNCFSRILLIFNIVKECM